MNFVNCGAAVRIIIGACLIVVTAMPPLASGQDRRTQVPQAVAADAQAIQDRFAQVLEEECPNNVCTPVGCEVTRFLTLDERQGSSLPGLDFNDEPPKYLQYKLASVRCEFTYEPGMDDKGLSSVRQRVLQKVKFPGVSVALTSRKLDPKPDVANAADVPAHLPPPPPPVAPPTLTERFWTSLFPVMPWLISGVLAVIGLLALIWGLRRLGRPRTDQAEFALAAGGPGSALMPIGPSEREASPFMVLTKTDQLRAQITEAPSLAEQMLRPLIEAENYPELCLYLRHFGPDQLTAFRKKSQLHAKLSKLSEAYDQSEAKESVKEVWEFLERTERRLIAAKVRLESLPAADTLEDDFSFMANLSVDEAKGLLGDVSTTEAVVAVAHMPRALRDELFAISEPAFISAFVEQLATVDKLPDTFVRQTAAKLRQIFEDAGGDLKTVPLKRVPLLEQALNALGPKDRKDLWMGIAKSRPELIEAVSPRIFLDAALTYLPDDILTEAFLSLSPKVAAAYLDGLEGKKELLGRLKPRLAEAIGRYLNTGKPDKLLAGEARERIAAFVKEKDAQGAIDLAKINAQVVK